MSKTVKMRGSISGGHFVDNGDGTSTHVEHPQAGAVVTVSDEQAAQWLAQGMAVEPSAGELESAALNDKPTKRGA